MTTFGLTGGVGMGKSAAADLLSARGVPLVDTDKLARELVEPGQPALAEIQTTFGSQIIGPDGRLLRDNLAAIVFADTAARSRLESILHPRIAELWKATVQKWRGEGRTTSVVVIPLLFETHAEGQFDAVVCVACSSVTQRERLMNRGWSPREIEQRNSAQLPIEQKLARSNVVLWNDAGLDVLAAQLDRVFPPQSRR
jgi:dephospho-CoA kinase